MIKMNLMQFLRESDKVDEQLIEWPSNRYKKEVLLVSKMYWFLRITILGFIWMLTRLIIVIQLTRIKLV